jgi:hypothetical protein
MFSMHRLAPSVRGPCRLYTVHLGQENTSTSVWDEIYTDEEAARGLVEHRESFASCHGEKL